MLSFTNHIVRFIHLKVFVRLLARKLKSELPQVFLSLEVRNSILTPIYFHFLYSDIDLAVILSDVDFKFLTEVRRVLVKFKRLYPPMGEVEIYSEQEWERLCALKDEVQELYRPSRSIRKYFWMGAPEDEYQSPKRLRALRVLLRKLEVPKSPPFSVHVIGKLTAIMRRVVKEEEISGENSFYHTYFTCPLLAPQDHTNSGHRLSAFELVALGALFPTDEAGYFANKAGIDQIHQNQPHVKELWLKLREIDRLEFEGSKRGRI